MEEAQHRRDSNKGYGVQEGLPLQQQALHPEVDLQICLEDKGLALEVETPTQINSSTMVGRMVLMEAALVGKE